MRRYEAHRCGAGLCAVYHLAGGGQGGRAGRPRSPHSTADEPLTFRCDAEHDVELRRQFADARLLHRGELEGDGLELLRVLDALVDPVFLVAGLALDVALRREQLLATLLDLD